MKKVKYLVIMLLLAVLPLGFLACANKSNKLQFTYISSTRTADYLDVYINIKNTGKKVTIQKYSFSVSQKDSSLDNAVAQKINDDADVQDITIEAGENKTIKITFTNLSVAEQNALKSYTLKYITKTIKSFTVTAVR